MKQEATDTNIRIMLNKADGTIARIALLLHCIEHSENLGAIQNGIDVMDLDFGIDEQKVTDKDLLIDTDTVKRAIEIGKWFISENKRAYAVLAKKSKADIEDRIIDVLKKFGKLTARGIREHVNIKKTEDVERIVEILVSDNELKVEVDDLGKKLYFV